MELDVQNKLYNNPPRFFKKPPLEDIPKTFRMGQTANSINSSFHQHNKS